MTQENSSLSSPIPFPCLVFFHGLVILWTHPRFLPVVVSEIHLNQEITLPVFLHWLHVSGLTNDSTTGCQPLFNSSPPGQDPSL